MNAPTLTVTGQTPEEQMLAWADAYIAEHPDLHPMPDDRRGNRTDRPDERRGS